MQSQTVNRVCDIRCRLPATYFDALFGLLAGLGVLAQTWESRRPSASDSSAARSPSSRCMFMWIILAALCFGAVFDGLGAVRVMEGFFLQSLALGPWQVLILMQLSFLLMGAFLDDTAMLVIVAPLYVPLVDALGFDLVWYGVLYTITCQIAYMTPPFGYNLFLMRAMAPPEVTIGDIYRSILPFVLVMALALALVMVFPELALWLPALRYGG